MTCVDGYEIKSPIHEILFEENKGICTNNTQDNRLMYLY